MRQILEMSLIVNDKAEPITGSFRTVVTYDTLANLTYLNEIVHKRII